MLIVLSIFGEWIGTSFVGLDHFGCVEALIEIVDLEYFEIVINCGVRRIRN